MEVIALGAERGGYGAVFSIMSFLLLYFLVCYEVDDKTVNCWALARRNLHLSEYENGGGNEFLVRRLIVSSRVAS